MHWRVLIERPNNRYADAELDDIINYHAHAW
jgi:hypothetical protein